MSNYIKYYRRKNSASKEPTHQVIFRDNNQGFCVEISKMKLGSATVRAGQSRWTAESVTDLFSEESFEQFLKENELEEVNNY